MIVKDKDRKWVEHFPPMPTKRYWTAAVTTKQHLIVAGAWEEWAIQLSEHSGSDGHSNSSLVNSS